MKKIYILGDFLFTDKELASFEKDGCSGLFGKELSDILFDENAYKIINLEGPITNTTKKQIKGGSPNIKSTPEVMKVLSQIPNLLITGANNHIMDYERTGLEDTEHYLDLATIPHIGFSSSFDNIKSYHTFEINHRNTVVYALAQNEFSTLNSYSLGFGANPYDPLETFDDIRKIKSETNGSRLIIIFHGGKENYEYPTCDQKRICRKMIDCGADLVVCQHSHCVGTHENYKDGLIIYGTGNFLFNISNNPLWDTSVIPFVNDGVDVSYLAIKKQEDQKIRIVHGTDEEVIISGFNNRSKQAENNDFLSAQWNMYCQNNTRSFLCGGVFRYPRIVQKADHLLNGKITQLLLKNTKKNLTLLNYVRCEVINEMFRTILLQNTQHNKQ